MTTRLALPSIGCLSFTVIGTGYAVERQVDLQCASAYIYEFNMPKRILVVAHDRPLQKSRVHMLEAEGYSVEAVETDDDAIAMLLSERFDLILLGRTSRFAKFGIDQRIRERYPDALVLKIEPTYPMGSKYPSRIVDSEPLHVIDAIREMLGGDVALAAAEGA